MQQVICHMLIRNTYTIWNFVSFPVGSGYIRIYLMRISKPNSPIGFGNMELGYIFFPLPVKSHANEDCQHNPKGYKFYRKLRI